MNLYLIVSDFDLAAKLASWGFNNFMLYGYRPIQISQASENAKLICRDQLTNQLFVCTKQEYLQTLKLHELPSSKILVVYDVLMDDGFNWDKAIASAIGLEEVDGDPTVLIEEIKQKMKEYAFKPTLNEDPGNLTKILKE